MTIIIADTPAIPNPIGNNWVIISVKDVVDVIADHKIGCANVEGQVIEIGAQAWRMGGIACMRQLYRMVCETYQKKYNELCTTNHVGMWWDGIGSWQKPDIVNCQSGSGQY